MSDNSANQNGSQQSNPDYVRAAQVGDCAKIAAIQVPNMVGSLRQGTDLEIPAETFAPLTPVAVQAQWEATVSQPPAAGQRVLVAVGEGEVVGFAAMHLTDQPQAAGAKAAQADGSDAPQQAATAAVEAAAPASWPTPAVEITALEVADGYTQRGHGSRLLAAATDLAGKAGAKRVQVWIVAGDQARIGFYQGAGLAPAGVRRQLQVGSLPIFEHLWWARLD